MKKVYSNRKQNIFITGVAIAMLIIIFFSLYGISRIQLSNLIKKDIKGSVEEYNWNKSQIFDVNNYKKFVVKESEKFEILTLTDIHYANGGWYAAYVWTGEIANAKTDKEIKEIVKIANPDLIVVTGDIQTAWLNDKNFERFAKLMDGFDIPFTVTFGNHDAEHRADKAKLMNILQATKNCILDVGPTNLGTKVDPKDGGLGNTIVNLTRENGSVFYTLFFMDSGDWQNSESNLEAKKRGTHEYSSVSVGFADKKIDWYEWVLKGLEAHNKSVNAKLKMPKSTLFMHIGNKIYSYGVALGTFFNENYPYNDIPFDTEAEWSSPIDKTIDAKYSEYLKLFFNKINNFEQFKLDKTIITDEDLNKNMDELKYTIFEGYGEFMKNDKFISRMYGLGSTAHIVSGHNHCDGYEVEFAGFKLTSVVKTGSIYADKEWDMGNRGGTKITIYTENNIAKVETMPIYVLRDDYISQKYPR